MRGDVTEPAVDQRHSTCQIGEVLARRVERGRVAIDPDQPAVGSAAIEHGAGVACAPHCAIAVQGAGAGREVGEHLVPEDRGVVESGHLTSLERRKSCGQLLSSPVTPIIPQA